MGVGSGYDTDTRLADDEGATRGVLERGISPSGGGRRESAAGGGLREEQQNTGWRRRAQIRPNEPANEAGYGTGASTGVHAT